MNEYIGLDLSMKETALSIRRDGKRIWRGKCASDDVQIGRAVLASDAEIVDILLVRAQDQFIVWMEEDMAPQGA